ncbi:MAG: PAS domain-containing protein [Bacteroidia bacterium]|nr:PAS domain-containing protein [Bacteroidia bacterium]MDW8088835.1 PAS domain-containing protein [Bacteroidia bacterium]
MKRITAALFLLGFLGLLTAPLTYLLFIEPRARQTAHLAQDKLDKLRQVERKAWYMVVQNTPPAENLILPLLEVEEARTLLPLLQRLQEGIATQQDQQQLFEDLEKVEQALRHKRSVAEDTYRHSALLWLWGLPFLGGVLVAAGLVLAYRLQQERLRPYKATTEVLTAWRQGDWQSSIPPQAAERETLRLLQNLWRATESTVEALIENKPASTLPIPSEPHPLAQQLHTLQKVLQARQAAQAEWVLTVQSLAEFSEILKESQTISQLAERTITLLCKRLNAHMGAIFVRQGEELVLTGTYAYDFSQGGHRRFRIGEGFVGQAAMEKRLLRISPVPPAYIRLRSGLGEAVPQIILLSPLLFQEEAHGVVELASLEGFPPAVEEFLQKFSEHVGAALANFISREQLAALLTAEQSLRKTLEEKQAELLRSAELMEEAQQKLLESQAQLSSQILAIRQAALVAELDQGGAFTYANETFLSATGYPFSELRGKPFWALVQDPTLAEALKEAITQQAIWQGSLPLQTTFGQTLWLQATFAPLQGGAISGYLGIFFDITRQKRQEEELREMLTQTLAQEERLREANQRLQTLNEELLRTQTELKGQIAAVGNAAIVSETDLQGRIIRVNDLFLQIYGYRREEVLGQNHRILKSGHQPDTLFEEMWRTISQGKVWRGEVRNRSSTGEYYWILLTITPVIGPEQKVLKYIGVGFDITAQKRQEEELRAALELSQAQQRELRLYTQQLQAAQEEMQRTQIELRGQINAVNNAAIVAETDPKGRITFVNEAFCAISGYTREELLGQTHALLRSDQHDNAFFQNLWQTLLEKRVWSGIFCNRRKDGSLYWIKSTITPVVDTRGRLIKFIAVSFDLTPQIQQEQQLRAYAEELRQAQAELRGQIQAVGNAAYLMETDPEGHLIYANAAALEAWEYKWEEVRGQNLRFLNSGHHPPEFWQEMWEKLRQGSVWQAEVLNKSRSGRLFWELLTITPIFDAEGRLFKYIGVAFDITAQKRQAERIRSLLQEAQENERSLKAYAKQLEDIQTQLLATQLELSGRIQALNNAALVLEANAEGRLAFANEEAMYLLGFTPEELLGQPQESLFLASHPSRLLERLRERLEAGFVWRAEVLTKTKRGEPLWLHLTITPVCDAEGKPYKYIGVGFDITRQKVQAQRLRETLKALEQRSSGLSALPETIPWFVTNKEGLLQAASPGLAHLLGYSPEQLIGQPARLFRSPLTPNHTFLSLWATISRGKPWSGFLYNRLASGADELFFLAVFPQTDAYLALLLPAREACDTLRAEWLRNYAPLELLKDYELLLQAKDYEIYELRRIIEELQAQRL